MDEETSVVAYQDEATGEILHLAFSDIFTPEQTTVFRGITDQLRRAGETDTRRVFTQGVDSFNEEAARRGWAVRASFWERLAK